ncbi:MAG TPA: translocation/assembly module TamB domain-containing protein [Candidatus Eisenbacteria bacterium]|nr:translocation/assembly module TamB domain-containing protein [Candidatus Eisenbacteria bacterium]
MSPRARQVLKAIAAGLVTILVVAAGAVLWTLSTEGGTKWAFERLDALLPGDLTTVSVTGPIRGPLDIHGLVYSSDAMDVKVAHLRLDWRLQELVRRKLDILSLHADSVTVRLKTQAEAKQDSALRPLPDINLPVDIVVRDALVRTVAVWSAGASQPFELDRIALATRALRDTLGITHLIVHSARLDADIRGRALPQKAYPMDLVVDWRYRPPGRRELKGRGQLSGDLDSLQLSQQLESPFAARFDGRVDHIRRRPAVDGRASFENVALRELDPAWPAVVASGAVVAKGDAQAFVSHGFVRVETPSTGALDARYDVDHGLAGWNVRRLELTVPGRATHVTLAGRFVQQGERLALDGAWKDLVWPLHGDTVLASPAGRLRMGGALSRYTFDADGSVASPQLARGRWALSGAGNARGADLSSVRTALLGGELAGRGRIEWQPRVRWRLALTGTGIDPGRRWPSLVGRVALAGSTHGELGPGGPTGEVRVARLAGSAGGRPVAGSGAFQLARGHAVLRGVRLQLGTATASADGAVGGPWNLTWKVDAPDLAQALPLGGGVLHASGRFSGSARAPRLQATVRGDSLVLGDRHVRRLIADADLALAGKLDLNLDASGVMVGARRIDHLSIVSRGTRASHQLDVRTTAGADSLHAAARGAWGDHMWRGTLAQFDLVSRDAGRWNLVAPAPLAVSASAVEVRRMCWHSGAAQVCATDAAWSRLGPMRLDATLAHVPLELARFWMPPDVIAHGPLDGHIRLERSRAGAALADVALTPGPGVVSFPGGGGRDSVRFDRGSLTATTAGGTLAGRARFTFPGQGTLAADVRVPATAGLPPARRPLSGAVHAHMRDLTLIEMVQTEVQHAHGTLDADLALGGTVGHPALAGTARVRNGVADVGRVGLHLTAVTADLTGNRTGAIDLALSAQSGPGTLTVRGKGALAAWPPSGQVTMRGTNVQVMGTRDIKLQASPDLTAKLAGGRADVTGTIVFPNGNVNVVRRTDAAIVRPSSDVVLVGGPASADTGQALAITSRVRITVQPAVQIHAFGFNAQPQGSILAVDVPGHPVTATGQLKVVTGSFKAYGRELTIERGRLYYAGGPITDPALDFRATRTASDGTIAGVNVTGTAGKPLLAVFSEPALPEREALSYIVFGRKPSPGSQQEGRILDEATNALGIGGGNLLAGRLGSGLGLSEAQIASTGGQIKEAALSLGKSLSPRLYVQYGVGLFSPVNTVKLRYTVNRMLTLQIESAAQNSADLLYDSER